MWWQFYDKMWFGVPVTCIFLKSGFTPCKAEQPLQGMEIQRSTKRLLHTGNLFRKNLQLKDVC